MKYFHTDNSFIYLDAEYCECYIPMYYFDGEAFASDMGQTIKTLGIFMTGFFTEGKLTEIRTMSLPSWITMFVYDTEVKSIKFPHSEELVQCKVLKYLKGNKVMESSTIEDATNAVSYLKFITSGKLPPTIPYDKSSKIWRENQQMNGVSLGVPSVILELILSCSYRDKNDPTKKFASVIGQPKSTVSQYDYMMLSIRQICQYASTFTAMTFEDFDSMLTTSLNKSREHKPEAESPIEKIIKM